MPRMNHASGLLYVRFEVQYYAITKLNVSNDEYHSAVFWQRTPGIEAKQVTKTTTKTTTTTLPLLQFIYL